MSNQKNDTAMMQSVTPKNLEDLKEIGSFLQKQQVVIVNLESICDAIVAYIKNNAILTDTNHRYIEKIDEDYNDYLIMPPRRETAELDFTGIEVMHPKSVKKLHQIKEFLNEQKVVILCLENYYSIVVDYLCSDACGIDKNNVKKINKTSIAVMPAAKA